MKEGFIVKSLKGHDRDRIYVVVSVIDGNFVLVCDGEYRKLDNPKQKRIKHLEFLEESELPADISDKKLRTMCQISRRAYAERR